MKQVLFYTLFLLLPMLTYAQKPLKFSYKNKREYSLASKEWTKQSDADAKFTFNFKTKTVEQTLDGGALKTYTIRNYSEATDDETMEDCYLIYIEGESQRLMLYKREERGLRIIQESGAITNYYTNPNIKRK